jgi:phosphate starvation-inducible protein PhoH
VRHPLVARIVRAYERQEQRRDSSRPPSKGGPSSGNG